MKFEKKIYKYRQCLLGLDLKNVLKTLPKIIGINLILFLLLGTVLFFTTKFSNESTTREKVKVGLVTEDNSWWINTLASYLEQSVNCKFFRMSENDAMTKLKNDELTAVLFLPEDVVEAITSSKKNAATLIFQRPGPFSALKSFQNLAKTGMSDIAALDAAEKLIAKIQVEVNGKSNSSQVYSIEDKLLIKCLSRFSTFDRNVYSDSNNLDIRHFYLGNIFLALVLFTGVFLQDLLSKKSEGYLLSLNRLGIFQFEVSIIQLLSVAISYVLFFYCLYGIFAALGFIEFNGMALLGILVFVLDTIGFIFLIYQLCDSKFTASIFLFLSSLVMMFFSGNIIPISLLPAAARYLSVVLPTKYFAQLSGQVFAGEVSGLSLLIGLCWFGLFMGIQAIACKVQKSR